MGGNPPDEVLKKGVAPVPEMGGRGWAPVMPVEREGGN